MKAISGIVAQPEVTERISDVTASRSHHYEFSIADVRVSLSSSHDMDITEGDVVIVAGNIRFGRMTFFAFRNLSNGTCRDAGVISHLFVALFTLISGLFGVIITSVFLAPFSYVILAVTGISLFCLLYRSFVSVIARILVWRHRRQMTT